MSRTCVYAKNQALIYTVKDSSIQNIDDIFYVYSNNSALTASSRADLAGISGTKAFRVYANSTTWRSSAYDWGTEDYIGGKKCIKEI